jgi:hypothetical protein
MVADVTLSLAPSQYDKVQPETGAADEGVSSTVTASGGASTAAAARAEVAKAGAHGVTARGGVAAAGGAGLAGKGRAGVEKATDKVGDKSEAGGMASGGAKPSSRSSDQGEEVSQLLRFRQLDLSCSAVCNNCLDISFF